MGNRLRHSAFSAAGEDGDELAGAGEMFVAVEEAGAGASDPCWVAVFVSRRLPIVLLLGALLVQSAVRADAGVGVERFRIDEICSDVGGETQSTPPRSALQMCGSLRPN